MDKKKTEKIRKDLLQKQANLRIGALSNLIELRSEYLSERRRVSNIEKVLFSYKIGKLDVIIAGLEIL